MEFQPFELNGLIVYIGHIKFGTMVVSLNHSPNIYKCLGHFETKSLHNLTSKMKPRPITKIPECVSYTYTYHETINILHSYYMAHTFGIMILDFPNCVYRGEHYDYFFL